jgi:hypothetical protein
VTRGGAELEHFELLAEQLKVMDGLGALMAAVEHAGTEAVSAVMLADGDVLLPQRDTRRIAGGDRLHQGGLDLLPAVDFDPAVDTAAFQQRAVSSLVAPVKLATNRSAGRL